MQRFETSTFEKYNDLETQVRGSLKVIDRLHKTSYSCFVVTMALACTVSEI